MKERPVIFNAESVRAILAGRKTQTRRVAKNVPGWVTAFGFSAFTPKGKWSGRGSHPTDGPGESFFRCPYGQPGDRLWVRETWWQAEKPGGGVGVPFVYYDAEQCGGPDLIGPSREWDYSTAPGRWGRRPSIHMPRWASRLTLEVTAVRVERLRDISEADARQEGLQDHYGEVPFSSNVQRFADAWDRLSAKRGFGWDANPWVWVIGFGVRR
jgi:hypothetical protein